MFWIGVGVPDLRLLLDPCLVLWITSRCPALLKVTSYPDFISVKVAQGDTLPAIDSWCKIITKELKGGNEFF